MSTKDVVTHPWTATALDEELAEEISRLDDQIATLQRHRGLAEQELTRRLEGREALMLAHPYLQIELVYSTPSYDTAKLLALAEVIPPEDYHRAYHPEHVKEVQVAARFDGRQLNTLARRYGDPVRMILEGAKLPSNAKLVVRPKD